MSHKTENYHNIYYLNAENLDNIYYRGVIYGLFKIKL